MRENYTTAWSDDSIRFISSPSTFAATNLYYVQEIGHFHTLPGYFTEREGLDSYLIVYIQRGKGKLIYQGHTYTLEARQLFFIHCMPYHQYTADPNDPLELLWVHVYGSSISAYYEQYADQYEPVLPLANERIPELITRTLQIQQQKSAATELLTSQLLVELLTTILLSSQEKDLSESDKPAYIHAIRQTLEQRFSEPISLDQLAQKHAVSKYNMAKRFKQFTGFSPHEYLIGIRMVHAKEKLKYSDMPVSEIAAAVGIHNVSHFINLFRDRTGDTPLVYRKKWQRPR
ncbi:AraC family transcriptional regulator [Paenibacillus roseipurpureus]|uniref:AraC family transcriptional regulator n=1 Tax=Paenibacillus roseopurpureus TaxID=2918901 RepID=A0AA96LS96_9BACL|nr:AraC family transcriptional regulator [Paenibacillus sp. MBLB1832]WNR46306.1 AraC family transcriptional regulator [Paenibacillus sp. MBLB1832]